MADSAIVRTARALDLIPYVLEHPGISLDELAAYFKTTKSEISETLSILFMCGLPGYTHLELINMTTEEDEVEIIDPQNLDRPRKLSQGEIVSLILGLRNLASQLPQAELNKDIEVLANKLGNLLSNLDVLELIDLQPMNIDLDKLQIIQDACKQKLSIQIRYHSVGRDELTDRKVQPLRTYSRNGYVYFEASDENGNLRTFRLDRIEEIKLGEHQDSPLGSQLQGVLKIEIIVAASNVAFFELIEPLIVEKTLVGDSVAITVEVSHTDWLIRALNTIPADFQIVSPEAFETEFREFATTALNQYP